MEEAKNDNAQTDAADPAVTLDDYFAAVEREAEATPRWRKGQAAFNVLWGMRPDLSEQVRATPLDPFFRDDRLPAFYDWERQHWGERERA